MYCDVHYFSPSQNWTKKIKPRKNFQVRILFSFVYSVGGLKCCKHTRHVATVDGSLGGEGGAFRAARTTWTPDRAGGGGGGSGIPSLRRRRRRISLRRQSPPPTPTTHSVAVDSHTSPPTPKPSETTGRPTLLSGLWRASSSTDLRGRRFQPWSGHRWAALSCSWACTPCSTRARSLSTVRSQSIYYFA